MLSYLLIGLGGAVGSIARAWLATTVASLTGPAFPWGTILINVLGSFLIGFFGTLTATDGRFAANADLRTLVMIGFCGGFTTFSSFSLQTLELIRDDRAGQALGNIALSVTLCLASVALGASAGLSVRTSRLASAGGAADGSLGGSMVVAMHRPERAAGMLSTAASLLSLGKGRKVTLLAIAAPALAPLLPTEEVMTRERSSEIASHRASWARSMRESLDRWSRDQRDQGYQARWIEIGGDEARALTEHGRDANLLLLEQQPGDPGMRSRAHAALLGAARPVLLVPEGAGIDFTGTIAVAWQDNRHVRLAVRTAAPLLAAAARVIVIRIDAAPGAGIPSELRDLRATLVTPSHGEGKVGERLLACAREAGADLLVMGSYGRGAFRERLLDGVTETVLAAADLPVLMQHQHEA